MKSRIVLLLSCLFIFSFLKAQLPVLHVKVFYDSVSPATISDGVAVAFGNNFSNNVVIGEDAIKIVNPFENLAVERENQMLSIEKRKLPVAGDSIPLNLSGYTAGNYNFKIYTNSFSSITHLLWLKDEETGDSVLMNTGTDNIYPFTLLEGNSANYKKRFSLIFRTAQTLPILFENFTVENVKGRPFIKWRLSGFDIEKITLQRSLNVQNFSSVAEFKNLNGNYLDEEIIADKLYYRLAYLGFDGKIQYSNTIVFQKENSNWVNIPYTMVFNGNIAVEFYKKGVFYIDVYNLAGNRITTNKVETAGNERIHLNLPANIKKGVYIISIRNQVLSYNQKIWLH